MKVDRAFRVRIPQTNTSGWVQWYVVCSPSSAQETEAQKEATNQGQIGLTRAYLKNKRKKNILENLK